MENAARAHLRSARLLADEQADGVTMNCLRRGMLKPCMSFATLNGELIPAACENDLPAMYTQLLGQLLIGRPGFQHNPCYETERNHYYASHCTCPTKLYGPDGPDLPYLLRRFAHTNEGSCAIQVFWNPGDPVTMVRYYPGKPPALDVYAGKVVQSHPMPPAAGCTTNVEIEITDRSDACMVRATTTCCFAATTPASSGCSPSCTSSAWPTPAPPKSENECGDTAKKSSFAPALSLSYRPSFFARTLAARAGVRSFEVQKGRSETLPVAETEQRHFWTLNDLTPWLPRHAGRSPMSVLLVVLALPFVTGAGTPPDPDRVQAVAELPHRSPAGSGGRLPIGRRGRPWPGCPV